MGVRICGAKKCRRLAILTCDIYDPLEKKYVLIAACCKTHMMRQIQKTKWPRYSNKRAQRLIGTHKLREREEKDRVN